MKFARPALSGAHALSTPLPEAVVLDEIVTNSAANIEQIAARQKCSVRQVNMTISLAFLAPDLVKAAVEGRLPAASPTKIRMGSR
jgi:hypothetical protein